MPDQEPHSAHPERFISPETIFDFTSPIDAPVLTEAADTVNELKGIHYRTILSYLDAGEPAPEVAKTKTTIDDYIAHHTRYTRTNRAMNAVRQARESGMSTEQIRAQTQEKLHAIDNHEEAVWQALEGSRNARREQSELPTTHIEQLPVGPPGFLLRLLGKFTVRRP